MGGAKDAENSVDEVLQGGDIEALCITEEDLRKVRDPDHQIVCICMLQHVWRDT